jgi:hypothetical protein
MLPAVGHVRALPSATSLADDVDHLCLLLVDALASAHAHCDTHVAANPDRSASRGSRGDLALYP